ncbi:MAG: Uma2 family endonuclease [Acidimicrobiales bacterium]
MRTVILDPQPAEIEALIERRRVLGQDRFDEVWEGVYHMTPGPSGTHAYLDLELAALLRPLARAAGLVATSGFNLGAGAHDFRVPDGGYHRTMPLGTWIPTAAIVVEILSPGDETFEKFDFYARHGVEEIVVVDPMADTVNVWLVDAHGEFQPAQASQLLAVSAADLTSAIDWP